MLYAIDVLDNGLRTCLESFFIKDMPLISDSTVYSKNSLTPIHFFLSFGSIVYPIAQRQTQLSAEVAKQR